MKHWHDALLKKKKNTYKINVPFSMCCCPILYWCENKNLHAFSPHAFSSKLVTEGLLANCQDFFLFFAINGEKNYQMLTGSLSF